MAKKATTKKTAAKNDTAGDGFEVVSASPETLVTLAIRKLESTKGTSRETQFAINKLRQALKQMELNGFRERELEGMRAAQAGAAAKKRAEAGDNGEDAEPGFAEQVEYAIAAADAEEATKNAEADGD